MEGPFNWEDKICEQNC